MTTNTETPVSCPPSADFPLTCEFCRHEAATYLAVYDITIRGRAERVQKTIGPDCAAWNFPDRAREIAVSPRSVWLFRLVPEEPERAVRAQMEVSTDDAR